MKRSDWEKELKILLYSATVRTGKTQEELSEMMGYNRKYLTRKAHDSEFVSMPFAAVTLIAEAAGYDLVLTRRKPA